MTSTYFKNLIMGNVFNTKTDPTLPSTYYLALSSTAPSDDGSNVTEPSGGAYARVGVGSFSEPANGVITNTADIVFPESTSDWGTLTHFALFDAATGGNLLLWDELAKSRVVQSENQLRWKPNGITLTLTDITETV